VGLAATRKQPDNCRRNDNTLSKQLMAGKDLLTLAANVIAYLSLSSHPYGSPFPLNVFQHHDRIGVLG
jgi:hypothetical protein